MKRVLFVCVENAGRSQMAEAFARQLGAGVLEPASAGSRPLGRIHPLVAEAMKERGLELTGHSSKGLDSLDLAGFDIIVTLCDDECPWVEGQTLMHWETPNPADHGLESVRSIRDSIEARVHELVRSLRATH